MLQDLQVATEQVPVTSLKHLIPQLWSLHPHLKDLLFSSTPIYVLLSFDNPCNVTCFRKLVAHVDNYFLWILLSSVVISRILRQGSEDVLP